MSIWPAEYSVFDPIHTNRRKSLFGAYSVQTQLAFTPLPTLAVTHTSNRFPSIRLQQTINVINTVFNIFHYKKLCLHIDSIYES